MTGRRYFVQSEDGIRDIGVTGVQTCALPIYMGNHDVETGHAVFDRWVGSCRFPILGANIVDLSTDKPYLPPYKVFEREGVKVALLGMITPAVPVWLPENLWKGLRFDDMEETARRRMNVIREKDRKSVV